MMAGVEAVGSKYVIKDDLRFYTLLASRYFELRILLDNVRGHTLQLVLFFGIALALVFAAFLVFVSNNLE